MLGSSAFRLMCFYARVHERLCVYAFMHSCAWVGPGYGSVLFRRFWQRSGFPELGGRTRVPGQVGLLDFLRGRGHQGEPVVVEDPLPVLVQPEDADHGQGREPVLVAVVVDGVEVGAEGQGVAEEQRAQGVVGGGAAVGWPGRRGPARPGPTGRTCSCGLRRSGGAWPVRVSCLSADGDYAVSGILPASGPGEPPGAVSGSQWLPLAVPSGDADRVARPVAQGDHGHGGVIGVGPGRGAVTHQ